MNQTNDSVISRPHKAITEVKEAQIKVNLFEPPHKKSNSHLKVAETVNALSKSESRIKDKRDTNTKIRSKVSSTKSDQNTGRHKPKSKYNKIRGNN